jgi:hypothetical protein
MIREANRLLLALAALTHNNPTDGVNLNVLSPFAKMPDLGVGLDAATILEAQGYVTLTRSTRLEENRLQITPVGVAEAARLRLPFWRRWASDKPLVRQLIAGVIGAVLGAAATGLGRLLWP